MARDSAEHSDHLIVLIHGINTRALWLDVVKPSLESAGFRVAPTSYGKYSILRFLLPFRFFRRMAERRVLRNIHSAISIYNPSSISIIAHSFGTYVAASIIAEQPELHWNRIVFCGSVVKESFQIDQYLNRFNPPIINEVGTSDFWPAVAESIGWGYGSIGSTGLHHPAVVTRWHHGFAHGHFLTKEFTKKFWIPFLASGQVVEADPPAELPFYIRLVTAFPLRYLMPTALAAACVGLALMASARFADVTIAGLLVDETANPISGALVEIAEVGRTTTNKEGMFSFVIPFSKRSGQYSLTASAANFSPGKIQIEDKSASSIRLTLNRLFLKIDQLLEVGKFVSVSQNIGDPLFILQFKIKVKPSEPLYLQFEGVDVSKDDGSQTNQLQPVMVQRNFVPFINQYLQGVPIHDEALGTDFQFMFSDDQFNKWATINRIAGAYGNNWLEGCLKTEGLDKDIVAILRDYFESAFTWKSGDYTATVRYKLYGKAENLTWKFSLDDKSVARLRTMSDKIDKCGGVMLIPQQIGNLSYYDTTAQNFIFVTPDRIESDDRPQ